METIKLWLLKAKIVRGLIKPTCKPRISKMITKQSAILLKNSYMGIALCSSPVAG